MDKKKLLECIDFFYKLTIKEEDVTTTEEKENGQFVVIVTYEYKDMKYITNRLYYKNINIQRDVKHKDWNNQFFGEPVFWLDIDIHEWPDGSGVKLEDTVIPELANTGDNDFQEFLKLIANDSRNGFEQEILWDGRSPQYGINLENNNHWHDIILLIQKVIQSKGNEVDKKYFSRLVFEWDENSGARTSLHPQFGSRALIKALYLNIKSVQMELNNNQIINLLKYKYQIILQGPPGTGKTRLAKEIANELALKKNIDIDDIKSTIKIGIKISSITGYAIYEVVDISETNVTLKLESGSIQTPNFNKIIQAYAEKKWDGGTKGGDAYEAAIAKYVYKNGTNISKITIIQFHPAYSYEDFVRGITVKSIDGKIVYNTENRILAKFALDALLNYKEYSINKNSPSLEDWVRNCAKKYIESIGDYIDKNKRNYTLNESNAYVSKVDADTFTYYSSDYTSTGIGFELKFEEFYSYCLDPREDIRNYKGANYSKFVHKDKIGFSLMNDFWKFQDTQPQFVAKKIVDLNNYVLIIDEINRANLPAVLGELIYAIEYRGEKVESMYDIKGDNSLILPPNLYIIGTMNTADRSVGHIDYAIRRRFAFVDILPEIEPVHPLVQDIFKEVSKLFIHDFDEYLRLKEILPATETLSADFRPEDVWIGHSYFICKKENSDENLSDAEAKSILISKLKYEVLPILKEYIKDGILQDNEKTKAVLQKLMQWS